MPKVSVVLPTYNGEKYIRESIESICNQTFVDWELIIVNDCSTDNTLQIIDEFVKKDSRIKVICNEENQKLPRSLNIGFREATGEYLTWTSDDNIYLEKALECMVEFLNDNRDCYMVCTAMNFVDKNGDFMHKHVSYTNEDMYMYDCVGACFMYRREVLDDIGEYDPDLFLCEDYDYWLRILFKYGHIAYIEDILYLYRVHNESLSVRNYEIMRQFMKLRIKHISSLVSRIKEKKECLCEIYYMFKRFQVEDDMVNQLLVSHVPELCMDNAENPNKKIIIYGAGDYGNRAYRKFADRIAYYADKSKEKVGTYINDIEVISVEQMCKIGAEYQIIVAAGADKVYDFLTTLKMNGIEKCQVYYPIEKEN